MPQGDGRSRVDEQQLHPEERRDPLEQRAGVRQLFWHQGESGEGEEWQVTLKTTADRYPELESHLIAEHTWDNPEVTAVPLVGGSAAYLEWLSRTTAAAHGGSAP